MLRAFQFFPATVSSVFCVKNRYEVIWTLLFPPEIIAILIHVWIPIISFEWASIPPHQIGNVWKSSNLRDSWWKRTFWGGNYSRDFHLAFLCVTLVLNGQITAMNLAMMKLWWHLCNQLPNQIIFVLNFTIIIYIFYTSRTDKYGI